jgi:hypothetical protein
LVQASGPDIRKLSRGDTEGLQRIMQLAEVPLEWPAATKAAAIFTIIQELAEEIANPRWRAAAKAAFRLPADQYMGPEFDSLASRWRTLARREGALGAEAKGRAEAYRGYWIAAATHLADRLERRILELNRSPNSWRAYTTGAPPSPPRSLPISFDHTDVLYRLRGNRGIESISYRWLTAHAEVDHYEAVGWYYNEPDAPVQIIPLANCALDGPLRDLPQGGRCGTLRFSHTLKAGEHYFFAYMTRFNSDQPCRPTILYEVRGLEMRSLIIRAQFDPDAVPARCWYFNVEAQSEGWKTPGKNAPELLTIAPNGYLDHEFHHCERGRKYGLRWDWRHPE